MTKLLTINSIIGRVDRKKQDSPKLLIHTKRLHQTEEEMQV